MAEKNWLIRTKKRQILGPVTKQKVIEFVQKGALSDDDEVTSGNGYWFSISEKNLLDKYVHGDLPQSFNPISEAPNVLTIKEESNHTSSLNPDTMPNEQERPGASKEEVATMPNADTSSNEDDSGPSILPSDDDLGFPDMDEPQEETKLPDNSELDYPDMVSAEPIQAAPVVNIAKKLPASQVVVEELSQKSDEDAILPKGSDLEYPSIEEDISFKVATENSDEDSTQEIPPEIVQEIREPEADLQFSEVPVSEEAVPKKKVKKKSKTKKNRKTPKKRNDAAYLVVFFTLVAIALSGVYYYYTKILNKELGQLDGLKFIRNVKAQPIDVELLKKKV